MIKSEIKNYCNYCKEEIPPELISDLNNRKSFFCEACGKVNEIIDFNIQDFDENTKITDINPKLIEKEKISEKSVVKKSGYSQIRFFFFRYIYEILKSPENFSQISKSPKNFSQISKDQQKDQQKLDFLKLEPFSKTLRNMIINRQIPGEWLKDLDNIDRIILEQSYESMQCLLINKRLYRDEFFIYFCQWIEFVVKVINGSHEFSNLYGFKLEIAEDLKKTYGFASTINSYCNFEFSLTVYLSRYIYKDIKRPKLIDIFEKTEFYKKMKEVWINDLKSSHKKRFINRYVKFQDDLKLDQIYFQSFSHHLQYLEEFVSGLINDKQVLHDLKGIESVIVEDLKVKVFPKLNTTLHQKFKYNLLIVLSRFIFVIIKHYDNKAPLKKRIEESIVNKIANNLESMIVANNKLKGAWIEKLYNISREDFDQQYKELLRLLEADRIFKESFIEWMRMLTNIVFKVISGKKKGSKLQDFEKLLLKDLNSFFFESNFFFLMEELDFLKEIGIIISDLNSKWSWLSQDLAEKYFLSVLLPFYLVNPKLTYAELNKLGFRPFLTKLKRIQEINFSDIKKKYLSIEKELLIKSCVNEFGKERFQKKIANAGSRLEEIVGVISDISISRNRAKLKLFFDLGFFPVKCEECDVDIVFFMALQLHHPTKNKEISLMDFYKKVNYLKALKKFKSDKVRVLCNNHHLEKQIFYPNTFNDIIFKEDLFSLSAEKIDEHIDDYLLKFKETNDYKKNVYEKYTSKNKEIPKKILIRWKYEIKKWIRKRYIFSALFDGKCVICGSSDLTHLTLHHLSPELKDKIKQWQNVAYFDCEKIIRIIIKEKCISLCSNCHIFITSKYHLSVRKILHDFYLESEIETISKKVLSFYNKSIKMISSFNYDLENIDFRSPLKLEISQNDTWKIHLMSMNFYLKKKGMRYFYIRQFSNDISLNYKTVLKLTNKLISLKYIKKQVIENYENRISLTDLGKDKVLLLVKKYKSKANEIREKINNTVNSEYNFNTKSFDSYQDILIKYPVTIYEIITEKGINEFTSGELALKLNKSRVTINSHIRTKLLVNNIIEIVKNPNKMVFGKITNKNPPSREKSYTLTQKGLQIVKNMS